MLEQITQLDTDFFLYLNQFHSEFWDEVMKRVTNQIYWIWMFLLIIGTTIYYKKKESVWILIPLIIGVVLADHTVSSLFKPLIGRLRPCHNLEIQNLVHFPAGCGGKYGFFSSHASNSFIVAHFIYLSLAKGFKKWSTPIYVWAFLFSYSRIYLGKHYPLDILFGAICGILLAWCVNNLSNRIQSKYSK